MRTFILYKAAPFLLGGILGVGIVIAITVFGLFIGDILFQLFT